MPVKPLPCFDRRPHGNCRRNYSHYLTMGYHDGTHGAITGSEKTAFYAVATQNDYAAGRSFGRCCGCVGRCCSAPCNRRDIATARLASVGKILPIVRDVEGRDAGA